MAGKAEIPDRAVEVVPVLTGMSFEHVRAGPKVTPDHLDEIAANLAPMAQIGLVQIRQQFKFRISGIYSHSSGKSFVQ